MSTKSIITEKKKKADPAQKKVAAKKRVAKKSTANRSRKSKLHEMYGINRVDEPKRNGWMVVVHHVVKNEGDIKQKSAFKTKFFKDPEAETVEKSQARSLASAKRYRDKGLAESNIEKKQRNPVLIRKTEPTSADEGRGVTRASSELFGITRDDRPNAPTLSGWRVRLQGQKQKYFGDRKYEGKEKSLKEAMTYRDKILGDVKITEYELTPMRKARIAAGISQITAGKWMGVFEGTYARMERAQSPSHTTFENLFIKYCKKKLDPNEVMPEIDLYKIRSSLGKSQSEMSSLITGSNSQAPWSTWETGVTRVPYWVIRYIVQVLLPGNGIELTKKTK